MIVELKKLQPNPWRDFTVDPVEPVRVKALSASIEQDGFWGGIVCRRVPENGTVQIAAGHHRVQAALMAGVKTADVFVALDMDDESMIRVYARENATQRGNSSAAVAGTIASAIRFIAKGLLGGGTTFVGFQTKVGSIESLRGQLTSEHGLGREAVLAFLGDISGVNVNVVNQQLALLKASGDYARIIAEVQADIEREHKEALKALARAEKEQAEAQARAEESRQREQAAEEVRKAAVKAAKAAREDREKQDAALAAKRAALEEQKAEEFRKLAEKRQRDADVEMQKFAALRTTRDSAQKAVDAAGKREKAFDIAVNQVFANPHQLDVFRALVTGPGIAPHLAVAQQVPLAKKLVAEAARQGRELTAAFIREHIMMLVMGVKRTERKLSKDDEARLIESDFRAKFKQKQANFMQACRMLLAAGKDIDDLLKSWPKALAVPITSELRDTVASVGRMMDKLTRRL